MESDPEFYSRYVTESLLCSMVIYTWNLQAVWRFGDRCRVVVDSHHYRHLTYRNCRSISAFWYAINEKEDPIASNSIIIYNCTSHEKAKMWRMGIALRDKAAGHENVMLIPEMGKGPEFTTCTSVHKLLCSSDWPPVKIEILMYNRLTWYMWETVLSSSPNTPLSVCECKGFIPDSFLE